MTTACYSLILAKNQWLVKHMYAKAYLSYFTLHCCVHGKIWKYPKKIIEYYLGIKFRGFQIS